MSGFPASARPNPVGGTGATTPYTVGNLLAELDACEANYQANLPTLLRKEAEGGPDVLWWRNQLAAFRFQPHPQRMPGIGRIIAICNGEFGTDATPEAIRRLRGKLSTARRCAVDQVDSMSLVEFADAFTTSGGAGVVPAESGDSTPEKPKGRPTRKKRGRPKSSETSRRNDGLLEAWESGHYRTYAQLAREVHMQPDAVRKALGEARRRGRRRRN